MKLFFEDKSLTEDLIDDVRDSLADYLAYLDSDELVAIWNEYCDKDGYAYNIIYSFDEYTINDMFSSPYEAMRSAYSGSVSFNDDWFILNGYSNIETGDASDFVDIDNVVDYIIDNDYSFNNSDIRDILDKFAENED